MKIKIKKMEKWLFRHYNETVDNKTDEKNILKSTQFKKESERSVVEGL